MVTTDLLKAFVNCPTKCFLKARAEVETGNAYADWVRAQTAAFLSEGIKRLISGVAPENRTAGSQGMDCARLAQFQLVTDFSARSENLQSSCHAVERIPSAGRGRAA
jgi:hypothetical protein